MSKLRDVVRVLTGTMNERANDFGALLGDQRRSRASGVRITQDNAWRNSVWWGGLTLRQDVMSTFPMDVLRTGSDKLDYPMTTPKVLIEPFPGLLIHEYWYMTGMDLDRYGNTVSIIHAVDSFGLPAVLEPVGMSEANVSAKIKDNKIVSWRIRGKYYDPKVIWHERQVTLAGMPLGMSTLAAASQSMGVYQSAADFAADWFATGANPKGVLKNNRREKIPAQDRAAVKEGFKNSTQNGDIFVTGVEWDWTPSRTDAMSSGFLSQQEASNRDVCRYIGVPGSMLDVEVSTGNITYANVTQANLQWLITKIGPAVTRREMKWSAHALPQPRKLKLNTSALLRMDDAARIELEVKLATTMLRVPSELRALDNLPPYTPEQLAEVQMFARLRKPPPVGTPTNGEPAHA